MVLNKKNLPILRNERKLFWEKLTPEIEHLFDDKFENQLLRIFDFTAWIEQKLLKKSLTETLQQHINAKKL